MTCPIKHALNQAQLALGRVQQRHPQAGYTFTATYEAISAAREDLRRLHAVEQELADISDVVHTVFDALQDKIDAKGLIAKSNLHIYVNKLREGFTAK